MTRLPSFAVLLTVYLAAVTLVTFFLFYADKRRAVRHAFRIPESTLLFFCAIGGSLGGLAAMRLFRHKTKHRKFTIGVPLLLILQLAAALYAAWRASIFPFSVR